jgi:hypothetical protein
MIKDPASDGPIRLVPWQKRAPDLGPLEDQEFYVHLDAEIELEPDAGGMHPPRLGHACPKSDNRRKSSSVRRSSGIASPNDGFRLTTARAGHQFPSLTQTAAAVSLRPGPCDA